MQKQITPQRVIVGLSGASGATYGIRLLEVLAARADVETHLLISPAARVVIAQETAYTLAQVAQLADHVYRPEDIAAPIASGSFTVSAMVIVPCSIKRLSAVANSYAADVMSRAADVTLKEGRPLLLVVRETPLHVGHLRLMTRAAELGAVIFPPVPAFYGAAPGPLTVERLVDGTVGRILARMGIKNDLYPCWQGPDGSQ